MQIQPYQWYPNQSLQDDGLYGKVYSQQNTLFRREFPIPEYVVAEYYPQVAEIAREENAKPRNNQDITLEGLIETGMNGLKEAYRNYEISFDPINTFANCVRASIRYHMVESIDPEFGLLFRARGPPIDEEAAKNLTNRVYKLAFPMIHAYNWSQEAHDILQEVYLRVWSADVSGYIGFNNWVKRIALNFLRDMNRKKVVMNEVGFGDPETEPDTVSEDFAYAHSSLPRRRGSLYPNPVSDTEGMEETKKIMDFINGLQPLLAEVLLLRLEGSSYSEIVTKLGVTMGTVKSRIYYAKGALSELISGSELELNSG